MLISSPLARTSISPERRMQRAVSECGAILSRVRVTRATPARGGADLNTARAAAEERLRVDRNGCTSGRSRPRRANSNRGSARARCFDHRSIAFHDTSRAHHAPGSVVSALKNILGKCRRGVSIRALAAPAPWFGTTSTSKPASRIALSYDVAKTLSPYAPSCGRITQAVPHPREPSNQCGPKAVALAPRSSPGR